MGHLLRRSRDDQSQVARDLPSDLPSQAHSFCRRDVLPPRTLRSPSSNYSLPRSFFHHFARKNESSLDQERKHFGDIQRVVRHARWSAFHAVLRLCRRPERII